MDNLLSHSKIAIMKWVLKAIERILREIVGRGEQSNDTASALLWLADVIRDQSWEDLQ